MLQMAASSVMYCIPPVLDICFLAVLVLFLFALSGTVLFLGTVEGASNFNGSLPIQSLISSRHRRRAQQTPVWHTRHTHL
jgi:hypothetical protein